MRFREIKIKIINLYKTHGPIGFIKELAKRVLVKIRKQYLPESLRNWYRLKKNLEIFSEARKSLHSNEGKTVIAFPIIPWNFRWQRPQHILSKFAENGYTVLFVAMGVQPRGYRYKHDKEAGLDISLSKLTDNIFEICLFSEQQFNVYSQQLKEGDLDNLYAGLSFSLKHLGIINPIYMIQFPGWSNLAYRLKESFGGKLIFDCMDDHSGFSTNTTEALAEEHLLLKKADMVITSSHLLEDKAKKENLHTILVKNGTDFEHFHNIHPNGELNYLKDKPIIGYYGAISDWFDMETVIYCAREKPSWNVVLIGSTTGCDISAAEKIPNLHFLGEKPYAELPGYLYYFDVCMIPFKIIPLTLATNPVKFYEYLSCGKPIVSVKLPELLHYKDYCYLADNQTEFLAMLEQALAEKSDEKMIQKRIQLARENSWQHRFEEIISELEKKEEYLIS